MPFCKKNWSSMAAWRRRSRLALAGVMALPLLLCSCDIFIFSDQGRVKHEIRAQDKALSNEDFSTAATFYHRQMTWSQPEGAQLTGLPAISGFLNSIRTISGRDGFYTVTHQFQKLDDQRIVVYVTFQIPIVENAMTLDFNNVTWDAAVLWIKQGPGRWKIGGVRESTPRERGKFLHSIR